MPRKLYSIIVILLLFSNIISANKVDSLVKLANQAQGEEKVKLLLDVTWAMRNNAPKDAIAYCQQAINLADSLEQKYDLTKAYSFLGVLYRNLGFYSIAFTYYKQALDLARNNGFTDQLAYSYNNLGNIYLYQNQPKLAISYLKNADKLGDQLNNNDIRAYALQNIGRAYIALGNGDSAVYFIQKSLELREKEKMLSKLPVTYKYLADAYKLNGDLQKALKYYKLTAANADFNTDLDLFADYNFQMADLYLKLNNIDSATFYANMSLSSAKKVNTLYRLMNAYVILSKVYAQKQDYKKAYEYSQKALAVKNKIFTEEVVKGIKSIEFTEKAIKTQAEIQLLEKDLQIHELNTKRQKIITNAVLIALLLIIIFFAMLFRNYKKIKHISEELKKNNLIIKEQNTELNEQKDKLLSQTELLIKTNKELAAKDLVITQSINYAKRILDAMMGSEFMVEHCPLIKDHFIINKPKEIIGGDFFYFNKFDNFTAIVVADSTGHGVPGAFISIISISILKDLLFSSEVTTAAQVLEDFRKQIKSILRQDNGETQLKDGVDLTLCLIKPQEKTLEYAGAYNPLYIIKDKQLIEIKGTKSTAGFSLRELSFENHIFSLKEIDRIYMFTDGITDQLEGKSSIKFTAKRWRELIVNIQDLTMQGQKQEIEKTLLNWQGQRQQTDDILIVGMELNDIDKLLTNENQ